MIDLVVMIVHPKNNKKLLSIILKVRLRGLAIKFWNVFVHLQMNLNFRNESTSAAVEILIKRSYFQKIYWLIKMSVNSTFYQQNLWVLSFIL